MRIKIWTSVDRPLFCLCDNIIIFVSRFKGTGSPYKVTTMLLTALPFCFYHIRKRFPWITTNLQDCGCSDLNCAINSTL